MDLKTAKAELSKPLRFGDQKQINVLKWLDLVGMAVYVAKEKAEACDECDGNGEVKCTCSRCDDEHTAVCEECSGTGINNVLSFGTEEPDIVRAAQEVKKNGWPMKVA